PQSTWWGCSASSFGSVCSSPGCSSPACIRPLSTLNPKAQIEEHDLKSQLKSHIMADEPKIAEELKKEQYLPLLPVEKKLIAWSLSIGLTLLVVLYFISKLLPAAHQPL